MKRLRLSWRWRDFVGGIEDDPVVLHGCDRRGPLTRWVRVDNAQRRGGIWISERIEIIIRLRRVDRAGDR